MAAFKQNCIHCNTLLERDARFCSFCGSSFPFGYLCPNCLREINKDEERCSGCGRVLRVACPHCGKETFVQEKCEQCGKNLMVACSYKRCGVMQFFQNQKCTACGKKLKAKLKRE